MRGDPISRFALIGALAMALAAAAPGLALADPVSKTISDGAAKGQANEGTAQPTSGTSGTTGQYLHKKLPGRMKSGSLTRDATTSSQGAPANAQSNGLIGNHKDCCWDAAPPPATH